MQVDIELRRNFISAYNKMQNEYGEEMARLNGFAPEQLNYDRRMGVAGKR